MSHPSMSSPYTAEIRGQMARPWTRAEREIWRILEQGLLGYGFRRHAVLNGVLVNFYCPELGLIIEIQGDESGSGSAVAAAATDLKVASISAADVNRPNLVEAIERAVGRGRLWPED